MSDIGYYGRQLTGEEAEAYYAFLEGFSGMEKEIRIPAMTLSRLTEICEMVRLDAPMLFFLSGCSYRMTGESFMKCQPSYLFGREQAKALTAGLETRIGRILRPADGYDEVKALAYIRSWIFTGVTYEKLEKPYSHEVYGVLSHGIGVCEGIAKTAQLLASRLGVAGLTVIGEPNGENVRHAWNIFYLHGKPRHYDLTFDLARIGRGEKPVYAGMSDETIRRDHNKPVYPVPVCR